MLVVVAVLLAVYLGACLLTHAGLPVLQSMGRLCPPRDAASLVTPTASSIVSASFDTKALCGATGIRLVEGASYRLRLSIQGPAVKDDGVPWHDASLPAGPNGVRPEDAPWYMALLVPTRRHLSQPWFRLMTQVGDAQPEVQALEWRQPDRAEPLYEATIRPRRTGPLFLYVNDAAVTYWNNRGTGRLEVRLVE